MKRVRFVGVRMILFGIVAIGAAGLVVSGLWNVLMPVVFSLPEISFWQALGLLALSRILFGGWSGRGRMHKPRCVRSWKDLSPEERERFGHAMGGRVPWGEGGDEEAAKKV